MILIDYIIIIGYLLILIGIGIYLQAPGRRAVRTASSWAIAACRGGRWEPRAWRPIWNVSGTMIIAALVYAMGGTGIFH